jgi:predicted metal-dependent HD superfamily phosphohydrolase
MDRIGAALSAVFADSGERSLLEAAYGESHRHYHNRQHIESMLALTDELPRNIWRDPALLDAILYHDVRYDIDVPTGFNEAMSIMRYVKIRQFREECYHSVGDVVLMINASAHHTIDQPRNLSMVAQAFLDLDLASLAKPFDEFMADSQNIIKEFTTVFLPQHVLCGRVTFLNAMLSRKSIFYVKKEWERQARENLQKAVELHSKEIDCGKA